MQTHSILACVSSSSRATISERRCCRRPCAVVASCTERLAEDTGSRPGGVVYVERGHSGERVRLGGGCAWA